MTSNWNLDIPILTGALNLFGGILIQKRRAEKALEQSGLNFTIVRPGGMEKPGDDYKKKHNVRLETADKLFGGQVSRLQVAELITSAVTNPETANGKVNHSHHIMLIILIIFLQENSLSLLILKGSSEKVSGSSCLIPSQTVQGTASHLL